MTRQFRMSQWTAAFLVVVTFCGGSAAVNFIRWSGDPTVTCADVPATLLDQLVPRRGGITINSDASDGFYAQCSWSTRDDVAPHGYLSVDIRHYANRLFNSGEAQAQQDLEMNRGSQNFGDSAEQNRIVRLDGFDHSTFASLSGTKDGCDMVTIWMTYGADAIQISFSAIPSTVDLCLAAAAEVARAFIRAEP